eukprot:PhF_6_TR33273/c0_g2_i1/m.48758
MSVGSSRTLLCVLFFVLGHVSKLYVTPLFSTCANDRNVNHQTERKLYLHPLGSAMFQSALEVMRKHGHKSLSDKAHGHDYLPMYEKILEPYKRLKSFSMLEMDAPEPVVVRERAFYCSRRTLPMSCIMVLTGESATLHI